MPPGHRRALGNAPCSSWALAQECTRLWLGHNPGVRESSLRQLGSMSSTRSPVEAVQQLNQGGLRDPTWFFTSSLLFCRFLQEGCVRVHLMLARKHPCATLKRHKVWVTGLTGSLSQTSAVSLHLQQQGQLPASSAALPHHPFQHCASSAPCSAHGCTGPDLTPCSIWAISHPPKTPRVRRAALGLHF